MPSVLPKVKDNRLFFYMGTKDDSYIIADKLKTGFCESTYEHKSINFDAKDQSELWVT